MQKNIGDNLKKLIDDVMVIHKKMGAPLPEGTDYTHAIHRMNFLLEELTELTEACGLTIGVKHVNGKDIPQVFEVIGFSNFNEEEIIDGLVDLIYVAIGTGIYFGYHNTIGDKTLLEIAWDRVQRANDRKIPVESQKESKRGVRFDLKKPEGWQKPTFSDLIQILKERTKNASD